MQQIQDDLVDLGYKPYPVPLGVKLNETDRLRSACIRCDTCDGFPCLINAKADADINCCVWAYPLPHKPRMNLGPQTL